jgi:hypothetical protein
MRKGPVFVDEGLIELALKASEMRIRKELTEAELRDLIRKRNREIWHQGLGYLNIDFCLGELKKRRPRK